MSRNSSDHDLRRNRQTVESIGKRIDFALLGNKDGGAYAVLPGMTAAGIFTNLDLWVATTAYLLNDTVRPTVPNGLAYVCTTAGNSAATEPTWPTAAGDTVVDGTATWTCHVLRPSAIFIVE